MTKLKPHHLSRRKKYYFACLQISIPIKIYIYIYNVYTCFRARREKRWLKKKSRAWHEQASTWNATYGYLLIRICRLRKKKKKIMSLTKNVFEQPAVRILPFSLLTSNFKTKKKKKGRGKIALLTTSGAEWMTLSPHKSPRVSHKKTFQAKLCGIL